MKFSDLIKNKKNLTGKDKSDYKELIRTYNKIKLDDKDLLSVEDVRRAKQLRKDMTYQTTRVKSKIKGLQNAFSDDSDYKDQFNRAIENHLFVRTADREQDDIYASIYFSADQYIPFLEERLNELTAFANNKDISSVKYKQFFKLNPSNKDLGFSKFLMREYGIFEPNPEVLHELGATIQALREATELAGISIEYTDIMNGTDKLLNLRYLGKTYLSGDEGKAAAYEEIQQMLREIKK